MFKEQGFTPEIGDNQAEKKDDIKLKEYWEKYSTDELKEALKPGDPMDDMWGMTPDHNEFGEDFNPSKSNQEVIEEILKERE
jgi:hypothetical protein